MASSSWRKPQCDSLSPTFRWAFNETTTSFLLLISARAQTHTTPEGEGDLRKYQGWRTKGCSADVSIDGRVGVWWEGEMIFGAQIQQNLKYSGGGSDSSFTFWAAMSSCRKYSSVKGQQSICVDAQIQKKKKLLTQRWHVTMWSRFDGCVNHIRPKQRAEKRKKYLINAALSDASVMYLLLRMARSCHGVIICLLSYSPYHCNIYNF